MKLGRACSKPKSGSIFTDQFSYKKQKQNKTRIVLSNNKKIVPDCKPQNNLELVGSSEIMSFLICNGIL